MLPEDVYVCWRQKAARCIFRCVYFVKTQTKTLPDTKQVKDGDNSDTKQKKHDMAERNFGTEENESGRRKNSGKKKKELTKRRALHS